MSYPHIHGATPCNLALLETSLQSSACQTRFLFNDWMFVICCSCVVMCGVLSLGLSPRFIVRKYPCFVTPFQSILRFLR